MRSGLLLAPVSFAITSSPTDAELSDVTLSLPPDRDERRPLASAAGVQQRHRRG
jgi:hypothetical protein